MNSNLIQLFTYAALMSGIIFIPLMAREFGATDLEVGFIVAAYNFTVFLSSYIFGRASDMHGRKLLLNLGLLASALSFFLQVFVDSAFSLMMLRALVGFCVGIYPPALTAYIYERKESLGKFSAYGSLGWGIGSFLAGAVAVYSQIFILGSGMFFLAFLISLRMPETKMEKLKIPFFPTKLVRENLSVYLPFLLRHLGALAIWTVFPFFLVELGADKFWIGAIYSVNTIVQFLVMRRLDRFNSTSLFRAGMLLSALTFLSFTLAQDHYQMIPTQILLGFSWSCVYVGSLLFLTERNVERATSVGILNSVIGFAGILGPILGGIISEFLGLREVMYFAVLLTLIGFLLNSLLLKNVRSGTLPE